MTTQTLPDAGTITMYSTTWCGYCRRLKTQLDSAGIGYTEVNIEEHPDAASLVESLNGGNQTVPTVVFPDGSAATNPSLAQVRARPQLSGPPNHSSTSARAIDARPGGETSPDRTASASSSRENHRASVSSTPSTVTSVDSARGAEADHERRRERPRLAPPVGDVTDEHPGLLGHLAADGVLERLPRLHEARERRPPPRRPVRGVPEQDPVVGVDHRHDHRGVGARVVLGAVVDADPRPAGLRDACRGSAAGAARVPGVPGVERDGRGGQTRLVRGQLRADVAQRASTSARRAGAGTVGSTSAGAAWTRTSDASPTRGAGRRSGHPQGQVRLARLTPTEQEPAVVVRSGRPDLRRPQQRDPRARRR